MCKPSGAVISFQVPLNPEPPYHFSRLVLISAVPGWGAVPEPRIRSVGTILPRLLRRDLTRAEQPQSHSRESQRLMDGHLTPKLQHTPGQHNEGSRLALA